MHSLLHIRKLTFRRFSGFFLTAVYVMIALGPLAPVALHSRTVLHAVTGGCAGDCAVCGCSSEVRANGTCCCALKRKVQQDHALNEAHSTKAALPTSAAAATEKHSCCSGKKVELVHDERDAHGQPTDNKTANVLKCGCPCGSGKQFALSGVSFESIPVSVPMFTSPHEDITAHVSMSRRLTSRYCEPPDPPPRLSYIS